MDAADEQQTQGVSLNMSTAKTPPRTAAAINARLSQIGVELAQGRMVPVPNARALEAEEAALKVEYVAALNRDGEAARDAAEITARVESARQEKRAEEREARIKKSVADATR